MNIDMRQARMQEVCGYGAVHVIITSIIEPDCLSGGKILISLLREKLPESLQPDVDEVELFIMQNKNRQAWIKMDEIKKNPLWSSTSEYLDLVEKSWYYLLIEHNLTMSILYWRL